MNPHASRCQRYSEEIRFLANLPSPSRWESARLAELRVNLAISQRWASDFARRADICARVARAIIDSTLSRTLPALPASEALALRAHAAQIESREEFGTHPYAPVISLRSFRLAAQGAVRRATVSTL